MNTSLENSESLELLNETGQRKGADRRTDDGPVTTERRTVQRRRLIDPTTCERDYSNDEIEFMRAMDDYKRKSGRMFPTCSEILEVIRGLGYVRVELTEEVTVEIDAADANSASQEYGSVRTPAMIDSDLAEFEDVEPSLDDYDSEDYED